MTRTMRIWLAAILAVVLALLGYSRIRESGESPAVEQQTAGAAEEASMDETANGGVQTTEGDPLESGAGRATAGAPRARQGSSSAKGSTSRESLPQATIPRGFEIAFSRANWQRGGADIHLVNSDGSDLRKLRDGVEPEWSPDGKLIAFTGYIDRENIQLMNVDGSGLQDLRVDGYSPTWSPGGRQLAFAWKCLSQSGKACSLEGSWASEPLEDCGPECGIGVVARDGTGVRHIGDGIWPDWGPDGRILFADGIPDGPCYYDQGRGWTKAGPECELPIWVMNPDGSGRTRLPIDKAIRPTWSRDGRRIAYGTATNGIFIAKSDGTGIDKVAPAGYAQPSWSPDGLWLALKGRTSQGSSIYLRRIDGSEETRLTSDVRANDNFPAFSPQR